MSELDRIYAQIEAKRAEQLRQRQERQRVAHQFLVEVFEQDLAPSQTLKMHGIEAHMIDGRIVLLRPSSGHFEEPYNIVAGAEGEIDAGGRSMGAYLPEDRSERKAKLKAELIGEIIAFFDL